MDFVTGCVLFTINQKRPVEFTGEQEIYRLLRTSCCRRQKSDPHTKQTPWKLDASITLLSLVVRCSLTKWYHARAKTSFCPVLAVRVYGTLSDGLDFDDDAQQLRVLVLVPRSMLPTMLVLMLMLNRSFKLPLTEVVVMFRFSPASSTS